MKSDEHSGVPNSSLDQQNELGETVPFPELLRLDWFAINRIIWLDNVESIALKLFRPFQRLVFSVEIKFDWFRFESPESRSAYKASN
jgi:hypothetical protein